MNHVSTIKSTLVFPYVSPSNKQSEWHPGSGARSERCRNAGWAAFLAVFLANSSELNGSFGELTIQNGEFTGSAVDFRGF